MNDVDYKIPRVQEMLVMGSLQSNEADHRTKKAMSAMMALERRKHERYKQVVQASLLQTWETWSWTKELAHTLCMALRALHTTALVLRS